ncbi:hypothetical protein BFP71_04195 [Roseivirga misakiensis]|uniref:Uncharacterized protein n=1 Tax=Roseivirga misakiensis TaxID=1563681 RepID=A0A1E5T7C6_9BACT|nr:hypothetical protein BFP71_04195 [Roseivirga misakiensis]
MLKSLIASMLLAGVIFGLHQIEASEKFIHPGIWTIVIFSALLGMLVVAVGHWGLTTLDAQTRTNLFLGLTVMRLLLSMIFIGIVVFAGLEGKVLWVANFFAVYLFYLVFEIYTILSNLRAISTEGEKT